VCRRCGAFAFFFFGRILLRKITPPRAATEDDDAFQHGQAYLWPLCSTSYPALRDQNGHAERVRSRMHSAIGSAACAGHQTRARRRQLQLHLSLALHQGLL
jgi:hypothetical protein